MAVKLRRWCSGRLWQCQIVGGDGENGRVGCVGVIFQRRNNKLPTFNVLESIAISVQVQTSTLKERKRRGDWRW
jgi:hypothetical protein